MILDKSQAKAIYDAMCALNNVSGKITAKFGKQDWDFTSAFETESGEIIVTRAYHYKTQEREIYNNQAEFAAAYEVANV